MHGRCCKAQSHCVFLLLDLFLDTLTVSSSVVGGISGVTAGKGFACVESQQAAEGIKAL